jgi:hypothetical protein
MGTGPKKWTEQVLQRRFKAGHGQGEAESYKSFFFVQEFSSRGTQTRIASRIVRRTIHTMSYIERALYLYHEHAGFDDYWENYPASREFTLEHARTHGIAHPRYPKSGAFKYVTIDAIVTRSVNGTCTRTAWDAKAEEDLTDPDTLATLGLARAFCQHMGWEHHVFTWSFVGRSFIDNLDLLRGALPKEGECTTDLATLEVHQVRMLADLSSNRQVLSIRDYCAQYDCDNRLPEGMGLRIFYNLAWHARVQVDLEVQRLELQPVPIGVARS